MAITKIPSGKYQVKVLGSDCKWLTKAFTSMREAEAQEALWKQQKRDGVVVTNQAGKISLDQFFQNWSENIPTKASKRWKKSQVNLYWTYISPVIGARKVKTIGSIHVVHVFRNPELEKRSGSTKRHVYILLRRLFRDAIEFYHLITFNPVVRTLRPDVPLKEAPHLNINELRTLLQYVTNRPYGVAIWLQLYLGLRVGELQALRWEDVDLIAEVVHIRRTFVTHEWAFKDYPKGKRQHSHRIPQELLFQLKAVGRQGEFVAVSPEGGMVTYKQYSKYLRRYCKELGIRKIGTHGLRHSTSAIYIDHGATRDDLRQLFAHSSLSVTDRYVHHRGTNLEKVAKVIQLFPRTFHKEESSSLNDSLDPQLCGGNEKES